MAGNAVIGALRVVLGADTASLETGLKTAATKLGIFAGIGIAAGEALGRAIGGTLRDIATGIPDAVKAFDELSKTSQKIGVPVEQLGALRYAAELAGVDSDSLSKGLGKLARSAIDAAQGSTTAVAAYQALGISFRDSNGNIKNVNQLLPQIADRFANMQDGTKKTALAMQIFGKAGADLIPLLNSGSAGLKDMADEAAQFGLIISTKTAVTAENFNDNLTRLSKGMAGMVTQVTANILPALAQFSQWMVDGAKQTRFFVDAADLLTRGFEVVARAAIIVYDNFDKIVKVGAIFVAANIGAAVISAGLAFVRLAAAIRATAIVFGVFELIRGISTRGLLLIAGLVALAAGAFDNFSDKIKTITETFKSILPEGVGKEIQTLLESMGLNLDGLTKDLKSWNAEAGKKGGGFDPNIYKTSKDALDSFIDSKKKQIAVFQAEAATIGQSNIVQQQAKIVAEGLATAQANHIPITQALKDKLQGLAETWSKWNETANFGKQIFEQTRTPAEQFAATMERLNLAFDYGKTNSELYARGVSQAQQQLVQADPAAQALGNSLETAFGKAIDGSSKFSDILKGLLQDLTKAMANQAFKQLLYGGQGGTSGGALGSLFSGVFGGGQSSYYFGGVNVPMIGGSGGGGLFSSIGKLFGFASGGSFDVGGSGGIDSQLVAFRASPNENVSVTKPGQGGGGDANVIVNNYGGSQVETRKKKNQDGGFDIEILIDRQVGALARRPGSNTNRALTDAFGAEQRLVGR